jgi:hypothetical protein
MVFLFVCGAVLPACSAQTNILQTDEEKMFLESPVNKAKQINYESESYFDYALIWGPFEELWVSSLFTLVHVLNREPWNNLTINVIGYQSWTGNWTVKKACDVRCGFLHIGFIGRNWLCVIGIRDVTAF